MCRQVGETTRKLAQLVLGLALVCWMSTAAMATPPTPLETVLTAVDFETLITAAAVALAAIVVVVVGFYFGFLLIKKYKNFGSERMTVEQWLEAIHTVLLAVSTSVAATQAAVEAQQATLARLQFLSHAGAIGIGFIAGCLTFKALLYSKNHKDIW
jgi:hypothetical protein